jgi:hypothetical protein
MIDEVVVPLHDCVLEISAPPAKERGLIMNNLVELYATPFTDKQEEFTVVESVFQMPETFLGDNWEDYHTEEDSYYLGESENRCPIPETIGDFINDCLRVWKVTLVWDSNLIKRGFRL